jgi:hypothetical protein
MLEFKTGELKSGKDGQGGKVKSRKQAIAIGISEARETIISAAVFPVTTNNNLFCVSAKTFELLCRWNRNH